MNEQIGSKNKSIDELDSQLELLKPDEIRIESMINYYSDLIMSAQNVEDEKGKKNLLSETFEKMNSDYSIQLEILRIQRWLNEKLKIERIFLILANIVISQDTLKATEMVG